MKRSQRLALALVAVWASVELAARERQVFKAQTNVVLVPVSVTKGREPVTGLAAADFEVTDNGVRQVVESVALDHVPIDVTLVLTEFGVDTADDYRRTLTLVESLGRSLRVEDRLRLVIVQDDIAGKVLTHPHRVLDDAIVKEIAPPRGTASAFWIPSGQVKWNFGAALVDSLYYALAWPVESGRRHLIVAFADGRDTASTLEANRLPSLAARSDAVVHAVLRGDPTQISGIFTRDWQASFREVDETVRRTGGTLSRTGQDWDALARIVADFRTSYVLRVVPRGVPAPGWHELGVKVTRPGAFTVRARKGYEA